MKYLLLLLLISTPALALSAKSALVETKVNKIAIDKEKFTIQMKLETAVKDSIDDGISSAIKEGICFTNMEFYNEVDDALLEKQSQLEALGYKVKVKKHKTDYETISVSWCKAK